ncbi:MAG TPA: FAD-dependent oxidoreductase [Roseateles sp.]|nr:FAD-dependent oxidoreductase [Roseateles sp.]
MLKTYTFPEYAYGQSPEQREGRVLRHPVVIIGAGPVGLTAALDCAARGLRVLLLDDNNSVSQGSRAVCYAKRTLEIWERLGLGAGLAEQGVRWQVGKVFFRDELAYQFDLLPQQQHRMPAMINLQQYHLEEALVRACQAEPLIDLRWKHKLVALAQRPEGLALQVETPDGRFALEADYLLACDGAGSDTRRMLGLDFEGQVFQDRFLIADVIMKADFPTERWFWFDPPFHLGQSVLLHKQCDGVWRIDFQLGREADPVEEKKPERVVPRIQAMLGPDVAFELEWVSVYQFACRRLERFRHGRVLFVGDSAHQVSPFGARGANSGVQDADNLGWKLKAVLDGVAPATLLDSYHAERAAAADENILNSTRSTDFISPKSRASLRLRDAVLELAKTEAFARPLVNSGRLSMPTHYAASPLNTPDEEAFDSAMRPGSPCLDAPQGQGGWLLDSFGRGFTLLSFGPLPPQDLAPALIVGADLVDTAGLIAERYDGRPGTVYLIRPDQHVAARWRSFDAAKVVAALRRCLGQE